MLTRQFRALLFRHGVISREIEAEQRAVNPDSMKLLRLKRIRLALKDQMRRLTSLIDAREEHRLLPVRVAQRSVPLKPRELRQ